MKYIVLFCILALLAFSGCAVREEPASSREPTRLITEDDYEDLQLKPRKEEPVEVDYGKEGTYRQNFENVKINKE